MSDTVSTSGYAVNSGEWRWGGGGRMQIFSGTGWHIFQIACKCRDLRIQDSRIHCWAGKELRKNPCSQNFLYIIDDPLPTQTLPLRGRQVTLHLFRDLWHDPDFDAIHCLSRRHQRIETFAVVGIDSFPLTHTYFFPCSHAGLPNYNSGFLRSWPSFSLPNNRPPKRLV